MKQEQQQTPSLSKHMVCQTGCTGAGATQLPSKVVWPRLAGMTAASMHRGVCGAARGHCQAQVCRVQTLDPGTQTLKTLEPKP